MRFLWLGLIGTAALAAQSEVSPDQCLGGQLVSAGEQTVTLRFNEKVITTPVAPDAEIWRQGADVAGLRDLVPGDNVYMKCVRSTPDGPVTAAIVAVPEGRDAVLLGPHRITAYGVCMGKLADVTGVSLSVKNDQGGCTVATNTRTRFWRGEDYPDASAMKEGDEVDIRYTVGYPGRVLTAESVEANVMKTEGRIVAAGPGQVVVREDRVGRVTVFIDGKTEFLPEDGKVEKGAMVLVIGLDLGHRSMRATRVFVEK